MTDIGRPPPPPRTVVGVDGSAASRAAVRWAAGRAGATRSGLILIHVTRPPAEGRLPAPPRIGDALDRERRFVRSIAPEVPVRTARVDGPVMWALGAASSVGAEMVVVGTNKSGFIHGTVYGSTSLQLAATARCPVVVVPAAAGIGVGVVLGGDGSPAGRAALMFAAAEASTLGTELLIVRVLPDRAGDDAVGAIEEAEAALLLNDLRSAAVSAHGASVDVRVIHGPTAQVLVTMSMGARLLVLGDARTEDGDDPLALGAVCHDALLNIQSPTVIVHVWDRISAGAPHELEAREGRP